jgi:type I restriction enzyme, S subunit
MAGEWIETIIGEQASLQRGYDITKKEQSEGRIPVVSSGGIFSYHDTAKATGPGVVLARKGNSIGRVQYVEGKYWPHDTTLWVTDFHGNVPRFVYYFFLDQYPQLAALDVGSANPTLNRNHIHPLEVLWPPVEEQRAIVRVLGALDDKIELNRRMNATLETLARAVFRSWFVDFDPVAAKASGRKPVGMSADTAALFPDAFADSPLGPIPKGWRVRPIGELVEVVGGSTPRTDDARFWTDGTIHWATPKDLANLADPVLATTERKITPLGLEQISSGLLPVGTVLLSSRAPIGYLAIATTPVAVNQGFIALKCGDSFPTVYVLHWLRENMDAIVERANGTTFLEISKSNFRPIPAVVASDLVIRAFVRHTQPLYDRIVSNVRQSATLTSLRDALLPRLLSGELRLKEAAANSVV